MTATLFTYGRFKAFYPAGGASAGQPLAGGKLYAYAAGTSTPQDTYTDQVGGTPNANPVILDENGEANVWLNGAYKFNLTDSANNQIGGWPVDNISDMLFATAFSATSVTSLTIGTGTQTLVIESGKSFTGGQFVVISSNANSANFMHGQVTSYVGTVLIVDVLDVGGSGTHEDWNIGLSAPQGIQGNAGTNGNDAHTGDVLPSYNTVKTGFYLLVDAASIGSATSGATYAESAAQNLYTLMWTNVSDSYAPVTGGRGVSAAADWAANKKLTLPPWPGRTPVAAGSGSGLTTRALGNSGGEETHTLTTPEMPAHTHTITGGFASPNDGGSGGPTRSVPSNGATNSTGGDGAHNNMQPWTAINWFIKN